MTEIKFPEPVKATIKLNGKTITADAKPIGDMANLLRVLWKRTK